MLAFCNVVQTLVGGASGNGFCQQGGQKYISIKFSHRDFKKKSSLKYYKP